MGGNKRVSALGAHCLFPSIGKQGASGHSQKRSVEPIEISHLPEDARAQGHGRDFIHFQNNHAYLYIAIPGLVLFLQTSSLMWARKQEK